MYTDVEYTEEGGYPRILLKGDTGEGHPACHEIPLQAVADRMELYGLESFEQAFEYIGLEAHQPEIADTLHEGIQAAYLEVTESEFAQTLMPNPQTDTRVRQTFMAPMAIDTRKREKLRQARTDHLQAIGMKSKIHSEPLVRMSDPTRPLERTRPAAAEALEATEEAVTTAVSVVQEHIEQVQAWRVDALCSYVPRVREQLESQHGDK